MSDLLQRLKQRKLVQWVLAYIAAAFALIQVLDIVSQHFAWSEQTMRFVIVALGIGILPVTVVAWYHGEKGEQRVTGAELLLLALVLTIGGAVVWRLAPVAGEGGARTPAQAVAEPGRNTIAVLPFESLSSDKDNAFFAEGIQEEIITQLAKIGTLKVISHASTQQYASKPERLAEIARQLGVANILEGSVQRAANAVHINLQLIRAATQENLWADSYNRMLDDIFGVEGEVARTVAGTLKAQLTGVEARLLAERPTNNPAAYEAYLRGITFRFRVDSAAINIERGIAAFGDAVRLDPEFGLAWANLSQLESYAYWYVDPSAHHAEAARKALENAQRLAADAPETLMAQGLELYWVRRDYDGARAIFERIRAQFPNFADAVWTLQAIARRQGRWDEARALGEETVALDPQNVPRLFDTAATLIALRDIPALNRLVDRGLIVAADDSGLLAARVVGQQMGGAFDAAQATIDRIHVAQRDTFVIEAIVRNAVQSRRYDGAIAVLKAQIESSEGLGTDLGEYTTLLGNLQRLAGDTAGARASYGHARDALEEQLRAEPECHLCLDRLAVAQAGLGDQKAALQSAQRAVALLPAANDAYVGPTYEEDLARLQARFGEKDAAIAALQRLMAIAYGYPPVTAAQLRSDPDWDNLRGDPRFEKLATGE